LDVAQAAVHSFGRLLDVLFEQLNVSEYFVTYLGLARGVIDKFPGEFVGELYAQIAELGCKLSDRDTENFHA
jgi:sorbitol-specific phosphotransferase system component IIC